MNIIYFAVGMLLPYLGEEYAYRQLVSRENKSSTDTLRLSERYGWRILWDACYFFVLFYTAYRIIFSDISLSWSEWLGYSIFVCAVVLRIWALRSLGQFYDAGIAIQADHQLVNDGPYRILRHPLHLATLGKITGLALLCPLWLTVPAIFTSLLLTLYLNRKEDLIHLIEFSSSFNEYYRSTWDIVDLFFWKSW
jgi:protein-S-isoprenylcysteine O-methyltransferase Ste14